MRIIFFLGGGPIGGLLFRLYERGIRNVMARHTFVPVPAYPSSETRRFIQHAVGSLLLLAVLTACGAPVLEKTTPIPVPTVPVPIGWTEFHQSGFSGAVKTSWSVTFMDSLDPDLQKEIYEVTKLTSAPESTSRGLAKEVSNAGSIFLIFMGRTGDFTTNVAINGCDPLKASDVEGATRVAVLKKGGVSASVMDSALYKNNSVDVVKIGFVPETDTHEARLKVGDCYTTATLTTVKGDASQLPDFGTFLSHLSITSVRR